MLKKLLAALTLSCLMACAELAPASPGLVAPPLLSPAAHLNRSVLDEKALLAIELAYKLARTAAETGIDAGLIKGERASQLAALDNQAWLALTTARSAYLTANAQTWRSALDSANAAVSALLPLLERKNP